MQYACVVERYERMLVGGFRGLSRELLVVVFVHVVWYDLDNVESLFSVCEVCFSWEVLQLCVCDNR